MPIVQRGTAYVPIKRAKKKSYKGLPIFEAYKSMCCDLIIAEAGRLEDVVTSFNKGEPIDLKFGVEKETKTFFWKAYVKRGQDLVINIQTKVGRSKAWAVQLNKEGNLVSDYMMEVPSEAYDYLVNDILPFYQDLDKNSEEGKEFHKMAKAIAKPKNIPKSRKGQKPDYDEESDMWVWIDA